MLNSLVFMTEMNMFFTDRIEVSANKTWRIHAVRLTGTKEEPKSYASSNNLELSEIYLAHSNGDALEDEPIRLGPFLIWQINETLKQSEIYFYNDAWRTKLEYLSYTSGSYYYHKELHSDFSELIQIKLKPGLEEDVHRFIPTEERVEHAESLFKQSNVYRAEGKLEDALECLEQSVEYHRNSETFLFMAKIQISLKDPKEAILQTLQNCLDIDPSNEEANMLRNKITGEVFQEEKPLITDDIESTKSYLQHPTLFHLLTPRSIRKFPYLFWIGIYLLWFILSGFSEFITGNNPKIILNVIQLLMSFTAFTSIFIGRYLLLRLQIPLSLQLDAMRLDRFTEWFQNQYKFIFSDIDLKYGNLIYNRQSTCEKGFTFLGITIIIIGGVIGYIMTELFNVSLFFMIKRWLDNMFVVVLVGIFVVRYVFAITVFIYKFSRLSLKPMLTKLNDDGFRSFAPLINFNLSIFITFYILMLLLMRFEFTFPVRLDYVFLALAVIFFITWSFGMPITLRIAARESKSKAVHAYSQHIEKSFKSFLNDPNQEKLDEYNWMLNNQKVISKISTWPLSWKETLLFIIGSNVTFFILTVWYILSRTGYWPILWNKFLSLF